MAATKRSQKAFDYYQALVAQGLRLEYMCGKWLLNGEETKLTGRNGAYYRFLMVLGDAWITEKKNQDALTHLVKSMIGDPDGAWPENQILTKAREKIALGVDPLAYPLTEKELKIIHYLLLPKEANGESYAFFFYGRGGSGKSTIGNIICQLFGEGDYCALPFSCIGDKFRRSELFGKRFWYDEDIAPDWRETWSSSFKKIITGGKDQFEEKFQNPFDGSYRCKALFCCNKLPRFDYTDSGMLRRVLIYRKETISERIETTEDLSLKVWSKEELVNFAAHALLTPIDDLEETFREETRRSIIEVNSIGKYLKENCIFKEISYDGYRSYCMSSGINAIFSRENYENYVKIFLEWGIYGEKES